MAITTVEWKDSTAPGVIGARIYRFNAGQIPTLNAFTQNYSVDNLLGEVGLGVETFDDTTAAENIPYDYAVQGYAPNGESTELIRNVNADSITLTSEGFITNFVFDGQVTSHMEDTNSTASLLDAGNPDQTHVLRVKRTTQNHQHGLLGCKGGGVIDLKLEVDSGDNEADGVLTDPNSGGVSFVGATVAGDASWQIYFMQYADATKTIQLYEGTTLVRTITDADDFFTSRTPGLKLLIGAAVFGGSSPGYLIGEVSDYQFYSRSIDAGERAALVADLSDTAVGLVSNFAGNKTANGSLAGEWISEDSGTKPLYTLTNNGTVTFN